MYRTVLYGTLYAAVYGTVLYHRAQRLTRSTSSVHVVTRSYLINTLAVCIILYCTQAVLYRTVADCTVLYCGCHWVVSFMPVLTCQCHQPVIKVFYSASD
jgi:hypothetical protein